MLADGHQFSKEDLGTLLAEIDPAVLTGLMPLTGGVITMVFTDIVDSTRINEAVGDEVYFAALDKHYDVIRQCLRTHNGRELKTMGD